MTEVEQKAMLDKVSETVKGELNLYTSKKDLELAVNAATEKMKEDFDGVAALKSKLSEIEKAAIAQGEFLEKMKTQGSAEPKTIKSQLEANKESFKRILSGDMTAKATIIPSAITNNFNGQVIPGIGQLPYRTNALRPTLNQAALASNNQLTLRYMDQTANASGAASRSVGNAAGEMTNTWQGYNLNVEQYSHMIPVALEMLEDFDFVENEIKTNLLRGLDLKIEYDILNGTGATPQIAGILGASKYTAFVAPDGLANNVEKANVLDVIMSATSVVEKDSQYMSNTVWMNNFDAMALKLQKDSDGKSIFPTFISANGMLIGGVKIVPTSLVAKNTMFVGDFNFATLFSKGVTVTVGTNADDFSKRKVTILANEPVALLVKAVNLGAISYISDITAAIAAINKGA